MYPNQTGSLINPWEKRDARHGDVEAGTPSLYTMLDATWDSWHNPPLQIPEPFYSLVRNTPLPDNVGLWSAGQSPLQLYNLPGYLGSRYTRGDWQHVWDVYAGLVALLDHCVGQIISRLTAPAAFLCPWTRRAPHVRAMIRTSTLRPGSAMGSPFDFCRRFRCSW